MRVSLVCTVLNEEDSVNSLLDSILAQSRQPDEVVIVDGGSRDRTVERLRPYQDRLSLKIAIDPGCNISQGRNRAIRAATGDIIVSTDAGVVLDPRWVEELIAPFGRKPGPAVACGFFVADPRTPFEIALGAAVLPNLEEIDPARFLPSSRSVAFTREAWKAVGGYPEWLDYCEDLVFDMKLRKAGPLFAWAPGAIVHFRPRSSLAAFFRQYYHYARGDGKADLWRKRHAIRYASHLLGFVFVIAGWRHPWVWLLLMAVAAAYSYRPYLRLMPHLGKLSTTQRLSAILWIPLIRLTGDFAKMIGYPAGVRWRRGHRDKIEARGTY
ncbi:MAG: glycosyltransferase [Dehalococcoidia bacterium]|nr:glycosyltransferase [Dehalococcoidia bacterium]